MIYIAFVLSIFFIVMICVIVKAYLKDIEELEERLLQVEKRINEEQRSRKIELASFECGMLEHGENIKEIIKEINKLEKHKCNCGGEESMACKKGKGGKRK